jgi:hypothetical protein
LLAAEAKIEIEKKGRTLAAARGSAVLVQRISTREIREREREENRGCPKRVMEIGVFRRR